MRISGGASWDISIETIVENAPNWLPKKWLEKLFTIQGGMVVLFITGAAVTWYILIKDGFWQAFLGMFV